MIIGLTGNMGSGKDAAAALLSMIGFHRIAFADPIRNEVRDAITTGKFPDSCPLHMVHYLSTSEPGDAWRKPYGTEMRRVMQWWGCEYRRAENPDYWTNRAAENMSPNQNYAITDIRPFQNEHDFVRSRGGVIWKLVRPGTINNGIPGHISEQMDLLDPDAIIDNSGSLQDLALTIRIAYAMCH